MTLLNHHNGNYIGGLQDRKYSVPEPFPVIMAERPDLHWARLLMDDFGGKVSETTGVNQFFYHSSVCDDRELQELLQGVTAVDMYHRVLLTEAIRALGGDPRLEGYEGRYWSGDMVYYGTDVVDRLTADIALKKQTVQQYRQHIALIMDSSIQRLLERILKDEQYHVILLQSMLKKYIGK